MDPRPTPLSDELLQAWIDGRLGSANARTVADALAQDPAAHAQAEALRAQRQTLRAMHLDQLDAPLPPALASAAARLQARHERAQAAWRWGGLAASVLLAFGLGWLGRDWWGAGTQASGPALAQGAPLRQFARAATVAHAVYQPEQRHPVEVPAAQQEHLIQWLSKRLDRPLRVPDLGTAGYTLVGGRLLPGEAGARVTLYVGAVQPGASDAPDATATAFRFAEESGAAAFYWVDQGFGYALVGNLPRAPLLALATQVYRQLER